MWPCSFFYALTILRQFAAFKKDVDYVDFLDVQQLEMKKKIQGLCWDSDRFIRGFTEDGTRIGAASDPEASLWLNPQSFSIISGLADVGQAELVMANVYERLNTKYGALLMDPPYHATPLTARWLSSTIRVPRKTPAFSPSSPGLGWILAEAADGTWRPRFHLLYGKCARRPK